MMKNKKIVIIGISTLLASLLVHPQTSHAMSRTPPTNYQPGAVIDSIVPNPATQGEEVIFAGHGEDTDGSIIAYRWRSHIDNSLSTSSSFSTNALSVGNHNIYFMVQDDDGAWSNEVTKSLTITSNQPPQANLSATPQSGKTPLVVSFSGAGIDSDGTITGYSWDFGDGATSTEQNPIHTYYNPGTYVATLTVTDNDVARGSDSVTITATEPVNQPPTAGIITNRTSGEVPLKVEFTGSGDDTDGWITDYSWDFGDGNTSIEQNPTHIYQNPGIYVATLTVTDNDGARDSASVTITVENSSGTVGEIPQVMRFQARLEDAEGMSLGGTFTITFRLYDTDIGGEPIWEEIQDVYVEEGILDVKLGSVSTLDLPFDQQYWLGVEVGSDGEMSPRFEFTSVPYSFKSVQ